MSNKILIVEDDPSIQMGIKVSFEQENYEVITASDGITGVRYALEKKPDLILLDLMLPGKNGFDVCREVRASGYRKPIIMLTSKKEEVDKILGLEIGADDYVTKPFSIRELQARVRANLRRADIMPEPGQPAVINFGDFSMDLKKKELSKNGNLINISVKEFQILKYFTDHSGEVVTREMLLDDVWGYDSYPTTRTVDNYILNLRKLIEDDPSKPKHLLTVHTLGYKFQM